MKKIKFLMPVAAIVAITPITTMVACKDKDKDKEDKTLTKQEWLSQYKNKTEAITASVNSYTAEDITWVRSEVSTETNKEISVNIYNVNDSTDENGKQIEVLGCWDDENSVSTSINIANGEWSYDNMVKIIENEYPENHTFKIQNNELIFKGSDIWDDEGVHCEDQTELHFNANGYLTYREEKSLVGGVVTYSTIDKISYSKNPYEVLTFKQGVLDNDPKETSRILQEGKTYTFTFENTPIAISGFKLWYQDQLQLAIEDLVKAKNEGRATFSNNIQNPKHAAASGLSFDKIAAQSTITISFKPDQTRTYMFKFK